MKNHAKTQFLIFSNSSFVRAGTNFGKLIGFIDVPIVFMSIRWWRTQHPSPVMGGGEGSGLDPQMRVAFFFSLITFTLLFLFLTRKRYQLEQIQSEIDELYKEIQK